MNSVASVSLLMLTIGLTTGISASAENANKEKTVCEFISETAKAVNKDLIFESMEKSHSSPFVRNYLVQKTDWKENIDALELDPSKTLPQLTAVDYDEKYVRWAKNVGYLPFLGNWYKVFAHADSGAARSSRSTGAFISAVTGKQNLICAFDSDVIEIATQEPINRQRSIQNVGLDCQKAIEPSHVRRANIPLSQEMEKHLITEMGTDFPEGLFVRNAYITPPFVNGTELPRTNGPVLKIDVDNDGDEETLLRVNFSEANDRPCNTYYYDLLSNDLSKLGDPVLRKALFAAQGMSLKENGYRNLNCGRSHTILSVDGKNYISSHQKLSRHIFAIEENEALKLCHSKFTIEPIIVFDANKELSKQK